MGKLTLGCPAKLNLFLHITGRRRDGYHQLDTLFQLLDFGDQLTLRSNKSGVISLAESIPGIADDENLLVRAASKLQQASSSTLGVELSLDKRLPIGGGLGGGSSNAASVLLGLNRLWNLGLDIDQLAAIGLQLGADVPLFVRGHSCFATGIGEQILPVDLPQQWFLVVRPACSISTGSIFSHPQLTRDTVALRIPAAFGSEDYSRQEFGQYLMAQTAATTPFRNDCEAVVRQEYAAVDSALSWLGQFGEARLTGTGSCIFASFKSRCEAKSALAEIPAEMSGFVAQGVNRSIAHEELAHKELTGK